MTCPNTYNENSSVYHTFTFLDKDGNPQTPNTITYRIDCYTTGVEIKGDTAFTPVASEIEIEVLTTENVIQDNKNDLELKVITVSADYGAGSGIADIARHYIKNLRFL